MSKWGSISAWSLLLLSLLSISTQGQTITTWFGDGTESVLHAPSGLFIASGDTVYIADTGNHRIRRIDPTGSSTIVAGNGIAGFSGDNNPAAAAQLHSPSSVFVDSTGSLYIADRDNHRIRKVAGSTITTVAGSGTPGFSGDGSPAASARLHSPSSVFVDSTGSLYIADRDNHRIRKVDPAGIITTVAGNGQRGFFGDDLPATEATLAFPAAVWVDTAGIIFVADRFNQRVRKVYPDSIITTIAGRGEFGFSGDGDLAPTASFKSPIAIFGDSTGSLYIADQGNNRIRLVNMLREQTRATGVVSAQTAGPGEEIPIFSIGVFGDGFNSVSALSLSIADLSDSTRITPGDLAAVNVYRSGDLQFDSSDLLLGTLTTIRLDTLNAIDFTLSDVPPNLSEQFYLATAVWDTNAVEGHAIKVGFPQGGLTTSRGSIGHAVVASDADRVTMDIVATRLLFTRQPGGSVSGVSLATQPELTLLDAYGNIDTSFADTISLIVDGAGSLQNASALPDSGVVTFTALAYDAVEDDEIFTLIADDLPGGAEGDLPLVRSNSLRSNIFNDPPLFDLPSLILDEDESFTVSVADLVSDPDDSVFSWTYTSNHIDMTVVDGQLTVAPQKNWFGSDVITITVTDAHGASTSDLASIQVRPLKDPPEIAFPAEFSLAEDDTLRLSLREFVSDPEDPFSDLNLTYFPPTALSHEQTAEDSLKIWAPPDSSGLFDFSLQVRDPGGLTVLDTFQVIVVPVNDPPQLAVPDTVLPQQTALSLSLTNFARDPDDPLSALTWSATGDTYIAVTIDTAYRQAVIRPDSSWYGSGQVVFTAADTSGATATDTVNVEVVRVNLPPLLASLPDTSLAKGDTLIWNLEGFASDPDDSTPSLNWSLSGTFQGSASFIGSELVYIASRLPARTDSLTITLGDSLGLTSRNTLGITVINLPPRLLSLPPLELRPDSIATLTLNLYAEDDGPLRELTWTAAAASGLSIRLDAAVGALSVEPLADAFGRRTIAITVEDAEGASATDSLQISIHGAEGAPFRLSPLPALAVEVGQTFDALLLGDFVELLSPQVEAPTWEIDAGVHAEATILPAGVLRLSGLSPGVDSLLVTARHIQGTTQSAIAVVRVAQAPGDDPDPSDFDGDGVVDFDDFFRFADAFGATPTAPAWNPVFDLDESGEIDFDDFFRFADAFLRSQPAILVRLGEIPPLNLVEGGSTSLMLDDFLLVGIPDQVTWTATASDLVEVVIDPLTRQATVSGLKTGQGELSFTARTATGGEDSGTVQIAVLAAATASFRIDLPEAITLRRGRSTALNLDSYVSQADFPLEQMIWAAAASEGIQVSIRDRSAFIAAALDAPDGGQVVFTARSPDGEEVESAVQVNVR